MLLTFYEFLTAATVNRDFITACWNLSVNNISRSQVQYLDDACQNRLVPKQLCAYQCLQRSLIIIGRGSKSWIVKPYTFLYNIVKTMNNFYDFQVEFNTDLNIKQKLCAHCFEKLRAEGWVINKYNCMMFHYMDVSEIPVCGVDYETEVVPTRSHRYEGAMMRTIFYLRTCNGTHLVPSRVVVKIFFDVSVCVVLRSSRTGDPRKKHRKTIVRVLPNSIQTRLETEWRQGFAGAEVTTSETYHVNTYQLIMGNVIFRLSSYLSDIAVIYGISACETRYFIHNITIGVVFNKLFSIRISIKWL